MIGRLIGGLVLIIIIAAAAFWFLTMPQTLGQADLPKHAPDAAHGEQVFYAGGCESCHAAPDAKGDDKLKLGGGLALATAFGTFHVPNISPDKETGIGGWSTLQFVNAMKFGVDDEGEHLYPAFPYPSYQRMTLEDIIDLKAFLDTLPAVSNRVADHDLSFPFNIRRGIGLWKRLYVDGRSFTPDPAQSELINRGAYLVTGPGHCGECHSPRNFIGGVIASRALSGGPAPDGKGTVPNITPDKETGIGDWSEDEIASALSTGFTPDFDSLGGSMTAVQQNLARLPPDDIKAIAAYLKSLPPIRGEKRPAKDAPSS
jgi:mono/diheme cytochrome c family protein